MSEVQEKIAEDAADTFEYLTFRVGEEFFGVDILQVQEIRAWEDVTRIPNSHDYVMGALNLRGSIVPVYDLRLRLGMEFRKYDAETVVIMLNVEGHSGKRSIGITVDEVSDVFLTTHNEIKDAPDFGSRLNTEYISGITTVGERMITLLHAGMLQPPEQQIREIGDTEA